jgi:hypothetical protein
MNILKAGYDSSVNITKCYCLFNYCGITFYIGIKVSCNLPCITSPIAIADKFPFFSPSPEVYKWFRLSGSSKSRHLFYFYFYLVSIAWKGLKVNHVKLQVLVRKFIELHDKYMTYVNNCFMNHTLFHKVYWDNGVIKLSLLNIILCIL